MTKRENTKRIYVGGVPLGGGAAVTVQSMCNTKTADVAATLAQIERLAAAGCDIIRLAVPDMDAARAISAIRERSPLPLVADIHFDHRLAIEAARRGADKIRINPGNIGGAENVAAVAKECSLHNISIRIGVNGGSLEKPLLEKYGRPTAEAMAESARGHIKLLNDCGFDDICLSMKSSSVALTVAAYRLAAEEFPYPLHLGVTETGTSYNGLVRSAAGIGALLLEGIGDTLRVSLTADPVEEVRAGIAILKATELRRDGVRFISCPTCGRTEIDLISLANQVEARLSSCPRDITVAVMGCVVNGPGEAREADYGVAGGRGCGLLFKKGEIIRRVREDEIVDSLMELIESESEE
ncbi:MAG: flavodoxin-dependent (E)-4-hydroxy-3-methylbut-2-enyl-diphosphate synthase [Oscillospiraceae bacterium]